MAQPDPWGSVKVSIHAPAKGATMLSLVVQQMRRVSIHAPAKGATVQGPIVYANQIGFDPRPREGGDEVNAEYRKADAVFRSTPPRRGRRAG